ncbi:MAG TPA: hypothetical protein VM008_01895 [Phycisphaerae bacterium]|nr:hypothetical protein [Phycisphaerae bacterium]
MKSLTVQSLVDELNTWAGQALRSAESEPKPLRWGIEEMTSDFKHGREAMRRSGMTAEGVREIEQELEDLMKLAGEYDQRWNARRREEAGIEEGQVDWWRAMLLAETREERRNFSMQLQRLYIGAKELALRLAIYSPAGAPVDEEVAPLNTTKRRGRMPKVDSEARKATLIAILVKHPSMKDDITALARKVCADPKTVKSWIDENENHYRERVGRPKRK